MTHYLIFFLILSFWIPLCCIQVTFDNEYLYDAISIGLISDELKPAVHNPAFRAFKQIYIYTKNFYYILYRVSALYGTPAVYSVTQAFSLDI